MNLQIISRQIIEFLCTMVFYIVPFAGAGQLGTYLLYKTFYTPLWPVVPLYLGWTVLFQWNVQKQGGRTPVNFMKNLPLFRYIRDFYSMTLEKTSDLDPNKKYIFGYHPHGVLGVGAVVGFQTQALDFSKMFPGIISHMSVIPCILRCFLYRDILMSLGIIDVSRESLEYVLTKMGPGHSVLIIVGGGSEIKEVGYKDYYYLILKKRKGFVKLALQTGADLVPVFGFGQNNMCRHIAGPGSAYWRFSHWLYNKTKQYNFAITICCCFPFLFPWRSPINVVVGKPIQVTKIDSPSQDQIDELHTKYIDQLTEVFNTYKDKHNLQDAQLVLA